MSGRRGRGIRRRRRPRGCAVRPRGRGGPGGRGRGVRSREGFRRRRRRRRSRGRHGCRGRRNRRRPRPGAKIPAPARRRPRRPNRRPLARDDPPPRRAMTEREYGEWSGTVRCQGLRDCVVRAVPVGGERADFAPLFPASLEIKGRVAFDATHRFIRQVVDKSRTRAVTAAVCGPDPAADNSAFNDKAVAALASQYGKRERCGVAEPITGVPEVYFIPRGKLADKLMSSLARKSKVKLRGKGDMLMVAVHKRGIGPDAKPLPAEQPQVPHASDPLPTGAGGRGRLAQRIVGPSGRRQTGRRRHPGSPQPGQQPVRGRSPARGDAPAPRASPAHRRRAERDVGTFPRRSPAAHPGVLPVGPRRRPLRHRARARAPDGLPPEAAAVRRPAPSRVRQRRRGLPGRRTGAVSGRQVPAAAVASPGRPRRVQVAAARPRVRECGVRRAPARPGVRSGPVAAAGPGRRVWRAPGGGGGRWGGAGPPRGGYGPPPGPGGPHPHGYGGAPPPPRDYRGYGGNGGGPERRNVPPPPGRYQSS